MKTLITALTFCLLLNIVPAHAEKIVGGPKGGRMLEADDVRAEFYVEKDHTINLIFYDKDLKKVPVTTQTVSAVAEAPSGKVKLDFEKKNDELVSKSPLPEGHGYTVVVQLRASEAGKVKNFRIPFDTSTCGECGRAEYACTCDEH